METPATGMFGPGDYPADFVTLEEMFVTTDWYAPLADTLNSERMLEMVKRSAVVDCLIELAHDLDARGLVLVDDWEHEWAGKVAYEAVKAKALQPFERVPTHAGDPGFGPIPPETNVVHIDRDVPAKPSSPYTGS